MTNTPNNAFATPKKKLLLTMFFAISLLLMLCLISIVQGCVVKETAQKVTAKILKTAVSQKVIKGPNRGEGGNDNDQIFNSLTISPTDPDVVYVGSEGNGIFKSTDGGKTWRWLRKGLKYQESWYAEVYDMVIDPNDETIIYAALTNGPEPTKGKGARRVTTGGVYKSTDSGKSWEQKNSGLPNAAVTSIALDPNHSGTVFVGLDGQKPSRDAIKNIDIVGGIYKSTDGGKNWKALPIPQRGISNRFTRVLLRGEDPIAFFTSGYKFKEAKPGEPYQPDIEGSLGMIRSRDRGKTWEEINPGKGFISYFDVSSNGTLIYANARDTYKMEKSEDGGGSWQTLTVPVSGPVRISPADSNIILFCQGSAIFKTSDALSSYTSVLQVTGAVNDIEFAPSDPETIYVGSDGLTIHKSVDGGETFNKIANLREYINNQ